MKKIIEIILFMYGINFVFNFLVADVIGSDAAVSSQNSFTFPQNPVLFANRIASFAWMQAGFALQNAATDCEFDSVFPVSGTIQLNGGDLTLSRDLIFNNITTLQGLGVIIGQGHTVSLCPSISSLPSNTQSFQNTNLVLNSNIMLNSAITFNGTCSITGNGFALIIGSGSIIIGANATLTLKNIILQGVAATNVQCANDTGTLILDNVTWQQSNNFKYINGILQLKNNIIMEGIGNFAYQTNQICTIQSQSSLFLDKSFTFSYDAIRVASQDLITFVDATSQLLLNGATLYSTVTGLTLKKGTMLIQGYSTIACETKGSSTSKVDKGITFGDGTGSNDFNCIFDSASQLKLTQGSLSYKNSNSSSWSTVDNSSILIFADATTLRLYQQLNLGSGLVKFGSNCTMARSGAARIIGSTGSSNKINFVTI